MRWLTTPPVSRRRVGFTGLFALGMALLSPVNAQDQPAPDDAPAVAEAIEALRPAGQVVRYLQPADNDAVVLRNRSGITLRSLRIADDVSITLENCRDITIVSCDLRSIKASGTTNLRIYNSRIQNSPHNAVHLDDCHDVVIQGNRIQDVASGVYAHKSTAVQVVGNLVFDVQGPMPRGQLAQFDKVTGPHNLIMGNIGVNHHGRSNPEDMINLFQSVGTADSPIRVELNHLSGDPAKGSQDLSTSGSGIMLGDGGGQHQLALNNTLINTGQVGIGVAGGGDIRVEGNTVVGESSNIANVGLYTWNQYKDAATGPVTVVDNRVQWINKDGRSNPYWNGNGFTSVTQTDNTFGDMTLTPVRFAAPTDLAVPPLPFGQNANYPFPVQ